LRAVSAYDGIGRNGTAHAGLDGVSGEEFLETGLPQNPTSPPDGSIPGNRRAGVTIDLPADEVRRTEAAPTPGAEAAAADTAAPTERAETFTETGAPPLSETEAAGRSAGLRAGPSAGTLIAAALAGGIVAALAISLLAAANVLPFAKPESPPDLSGEVAELKSEIEALKRSPADDGLQPLRTQLAAMDEAIQDMRQQGETAAPDAGLQELQARLAEVERLASEAVPLNTADMETRLSDFSTELEALRESAAAGATVDSVAALQQELGDLASRVDALPDGDRVTAVETEVTALKARADTGAALALAGAADALQAALESGRPFAAELAALESLGAEEAILSGLRTHAEAGLPALTEIRARFETEVASGDLSPQLGGDAGAFDRLLQSARGLVEVRPSQPTDGNQPGAVVARIRANLAAGDLRAAHAEWDNLPEPLKARSADWAAAVAARVGAETLAAQLKSDALTRLSQTG
jgi:hypothetical protein